MKYVILVITTVFLTACGPANLNDCITEAAKAPTQQGVNAGIHACYQKFDK